MSKAAVDLAAARIEEAARQQAGPLIVAIDGRSGTGKSTLAEALSKRLPAVVIEGDNFRAGGTGIEGDPPTARAARCPLHPLARTEFGVVRFAAGSSSPLPRLRLEGLDGSLARTATRIDPAPIIVLEGVYAARPELRDLLHLCILVRVPEAQRQARLIAREGTLGPWELQWHEAEAWYFAHAAPLAAFDLVLNLDQAGAGPGWTRPRAAAGG